MAKKNEYKFTHGRFEKIRIRGDTKQANRIIIEKLGIEPTDIRPIFNLDKASHGKAIEFKIEEVRTRKKDTCQ